MKGPLNGWSLGDKAMSGPADGSVSFEQGGGVAVESAHGRGAETADAGADYDDIVFGGGR